MWVNEHVARCVYPSQSLNLSGMMQNLRLPESDVEIRDFKKHLLGNDLLKNA